jgi:RNA polymerase sigma-70 factor (ECF subfamily)
MEKAKGLPDVELFSKIKTGDTQAYETLFNRHWHTMFLFAHKLLRSEEEAKDITQSVFFYIWDKRGKIHIRESVQSYLLQAVRYRSLNRLKELLNTSQSLESIPEQLLPVLNDILQVIEYEELHHIVEKEVNSLPERTREIFRLSRYDQLSVREISRQLNISEQTVKNQLSIALKVLRQSIAVELLMIFLKIF